MKKQIGVTVDAQAWRAYRDLCSFEKLRPSEPIEEYVRLVLRNGSALNILRMMQGITKERSEGFEAYARVLLNWYTKGRHWIHVTDENEAPVEPMLLNALKDVADPQLRREIQEALMIRPGQQVGEKDRRKKSTGKEKPAIKEETGAELPGAADLERIGDIRKQVVGRDMDAEQAQEMLEKIHRLRGKLKSDQKGRSRNR